MKIATIGVEEWLNTWEKSAQYDIAQSTISSLTMGEILQLDGEQGATFYDRLNNEKMNYGWIEGSPDFKQEVAKLYRSVDPANILQTNGATGANLLALLALVEPGDHVIAEYPTYQPLYEIPRTLGAEVDYWHIRQEHSWNPDIGELKRLVRPDTKLICINNASNPLGTLLSVEALKQIAEIAQSVDAYVLSDEVYLPLQDTEQFVSMADLYDKAVVSNSLSKTYSVPGVRIGWTASNKEVADRFRVYRDYTMICDGVFNDALAVYVLQNRDKVLARNREIVLKNLAIAQAWIDAEPRVSWVPPRAVSTSFIQLDIPIDDERFCIDLLHNQGVLLVPGSRFELPRGARLGYCAAEPVLREGLKRLSAELRKFD
ncbi:MAG: aminotransferase [Raoultibacter sp.]